MNETSGEYRIEMNGISKKFGVVPVLQNVSLKVRPGEIHALIGENGAGKSTLIKILSGVHQKDQGTISLEGKAINPNNTHEGQQLGINVVYQELSLVNDLSVAENIYLHKLGASKFWMNWKQLRDDANRLIKSLGFEIDPSAKLRELSIVQKQVVEIAKALSEDTKVLVLDEPTTVFDPTEIVKLFDTLTQLKNKGISIIYISHHLNEIFKIADSVTVLKDGQNTGTLPISETNIDQIIQLMIGRELRDLYPDRKVEIGKDPMLVVKDLSARDTIVTNVSFDVKPGEVLGIAGLGGSGRTETAKLIFGADQKKSGTITLNGKPVQIKSPYHAVKNQIGFVPEDRKEQGIFLSLSIRKNISITSYKSIANKLGFISSKKEVDSVSTLIQKLKIKTSSPEDQVKNLSGGNQQKVVLAKWLSVDSKVLIIDEPTRGVDVGAKVDIYKLINETAQKGVGVIVISSDMGEIMGISDRIIVMHEGSIFGELTKNNFSEENILRLAIGEHLN